MIQRAVAERSLISEGGGGQIFIYSFSVSLTSFEYDYMIIRPPSLHQLLIFHGPLFINCMIQSIISEVDSLHSSLLRRRAIKQNVSKHFR